MNNDDRIDELEVKIAFQEKTIEDLSSALVDKERRIAVLEDAVQKLERALQVLAQRTRDGGEVIGAHPEDDPVPRSG